MREPDEQLLEKIEEARSLEDFPVADKAPEEIAQAAQTIDDATVALSEYLNVPASVRFDKDASLGEMRIVRNSDPTMVETWDDLSSQLFALEDLAAREGIALDMSDGEWVAYDVCDAETTRQHLQGATNLIYDLCEKVGYDPDEGFYYDELDRYENSSYDFNIKATALSETDYEQLLFAHRFSYPSAVEALENSELSAAIVFSETQVPTYAVCNVGEQLSRRAWEAEDRIALASAISSIARETNLQPIDVKKTVNDPEACEILGLKENELAAAKSAPEIVQDALDAMAEQIAEAQGNSSLQYDNLLADLKKYISGQASGRGDGVCPLGSVDKCLEKLQKICPKDGLEGLKAAGELGRLTSGWASMKLAAHMGITDKDSWVLREGTKR